MSDSSIPSVAIVDYGLGNLFSVKHACEWAGLRGLITSDRLEVQRADGVILPGVGAFGDAMEALQRLDLVEVLKDIAVSGKPLLGICLGLQLLMSESYEFGHHHGLGIIQGPVVRFETPTQTMSYPSPGTVKLLKVPQIGWNRIFRDGSISWDGGLLEHLRDGEFMYFVHSFYARPDDSLVVLSTSRYGDIEFCSSLTRGNIFACQFHPERSGLRGLMVYQNLATKLKRAE